MKEDKIQSVFSEIYKTHSWGGGSISGPGSDVEKVGAYIKVLESLLEARPEIRKIVDVGCGDWAFSRHINWGSRDYTGIDLVPDLIGYLNKTYGAPTRRFKALNAVEDDLPPGDLLIMKDVLQHLSNRSIHQVLKKITAFRYVLLTNDIKRLRHLPFPLHFVKFSRLKANVDIEDGGYRPVKLKKAPFNLRANKLTEFGVFFLNKYTDVKEVLLVEH